MESAPVACPIGMKGELRTHETYCFHCGTHVKNQKFCHYCGRKLLWDQRIPKMIDGKYSYRWVEGSIQLEPVWNARRRE